MKCPICNAWTLVIDTETNKNNTRRRRLECGNEHRFSTIETIIEKGYPVEAQARVRKEQNTVKTCWRT